MKRLITAALTAVLFLSGAACGSQEPENTAQSGEASAGLFAMDTYLNLTAYGEKAETALEQAQTRIRALESLWSVTDGHSEIYAANHSGGEAVTVSEDTANLVRYALDMAEQTGGALEPTLYPVLTAWGFTTDRFQVPEREELDRLLERVDYTKISLQGTRLTVPDGMQLDLGAVGKGCAADKTAAVLRENGVTSALLDFGGNILTIGSKPDGSPWRVGIRDPDSEGNLGVLELAGQGVSVSGGYEKYFVGEDGRRYWHILDPATGAPARSGLVQTAVVSEESKRCDALSTALFVMGLDGAVQYWREHRDFEMILLAEDRTVYVTEGLSDLFSLGQDRRAGRRRSSIARRMTGTASTTPTPPGSYPLRWTATPFLEKSTSRTGPENPCPP